jgi:polyisoprenoid-binding protein YceI
MRPFLRRALAAAFAFLAPLWVLEAQPAPSAALREFRIDAGHSEASFSIGFLGRPIKGRFDDIRGALVYAPTASGAPGASAITAVIATASISTGSRHRDEHLRSSDFFDAASYPTIIFQSRSIRTEGNRYMARGSLTMHGVTRQVDIPFRAAPQTPIEDPHGSTILVFEGSVRLARRDFGVLGGSQFNDWFDELRSATMADSVDITLAVEAWDTDFARVHRYDAALARVEKEGIATTIAAIQAARTKDPDSPSEYDVDQLGSALLRRERIDDAVALLTWNTKSSPQSSAAWTSLARALEVQHRVPGARAALTTALRLDPVNPRALELRRRIGE